MGVVGCAEETKCKPSETARLEAVNLTLSDGAPAGANLLYAFVLELDVPNLQPSLNAWSIRIFDDSHRTVDAKLNHNGFGFVTDVFVENPTLSWDTPPTGNEASKATVEITFTRRFKNASAILIYLPERFRHDIRHPNQLKSLN